MGSHRDPGLTARSVGSQATASAPPPPAHTPQLSMFVCLPACLLSRCYIRLMLARPCASSLYPRGGTPDFPGAQRRNS